MRRLLLLLLTTPALVAWQSAPARAGFGRRAARTASGAPRMVLAMRPTAPPAPQGSGAKVAGTDTVGVLLLNLGGPDTLDQVEPFLYNLFSDPEIITLPG
jgi:hypothetical protein